MPTERWNLDSYPFQKCMQILQVKNYPFYKHIVIHKYVKHKLVTNVNIYIYILLFSFHGNIFCNKLYT